MIGSPAASACLRWMHALTGGPARAHLRLLGALVGLIALKDLLVEQVVEGAMETPYRFVFPYLPVPRLPFDGAGALLALLLQSIAFAGAFGLIVGAAPRASAAALLLVYGYGFVGDRIGYTNNVYALLVLFALLALGSGRRLLLASACRRAAQLFHASIYLTGAVTKLGGLWLSGAILAAALRHYPTTQPRWSIWQSDALVRALACATVPLELALAAGLWHRRTRPWAAAAGLLFHGIIEAQLPVRAFGYLMVSGYVLFVEPATARRWQAALDERSPWLRGALALALALGLDLLLFRWTGHYEPRPEHGLPLLVGVLLAALGLLLGRRASPAAAARTPGRRALVAALAALLALHGWLLIKPALGRTTDFSFRLFSGLLTVQVELTELRQGRWEPFILRGLSHHAWSLRPRWVWWSWADERAVLEAYGAHLAAHTDAERIRLTITHAEDARPAAVEVLEWPRQGGLEGSPVRP